MKALSIAGSRPHTLIEVLCHPLAAVGIAPKRPVGVLPRMGRLGDAAVSAGRAHPVLCGAALAAMAIGLRWAYLHHRSKVSSSDDGTATDDAMANADAEADDDADRGSSGEDRSVK